jgi:hypothetical protein
MNVLFFCACYLVFYYSCKKKKIDADPNIQIISDDLSAYLFKLFICITSFKHTSKHDVQIGVVK